MKTIRQNLTEEEVQELSNGESIFITVGDTRIELYQGEECYHECTSNCRREGCNCNCGEYCLNREYKNTNSIIGDENYKDDSPRTEEEEEFNYQATLNKAKQND